MKRATEEVSVELAGAVAHTAPWGALAAATVARGAAAVRQTTAARAIAARSGDIAAFRGAVSTAAAAAERARITKSAKTKARSRRSSLPLGPTAPTHPLTLSGNIPIISRSNIRAPPPLFIYGPTGGGGRNSFIIIFAGCNNT